MHCDTDVENQGREDDTILPAENVCDGGAQEGTNESADGKNRDDEGLLECGDLTAARPERAEPIVHRLDTVDDTSVISGVTVTPRSILEFAHEYAKNVPVKNSAERSERAGDLTLERKRGR